MEPWVIGLGMVVVLSAMLVAVVLAGRHVDHQRDATGDVPGVVLEAEEIVRAAEIRLRREIDTDHDV
jgi:hypothetical protein